MHAWHDLNYGAVIYFPFPQTSPLLNLYPEAMGAKCTLDKLFQVICCGLYTVPGEEPPPPPPIPRRTNLSRHGTLRRVGTVNENGRPVRRSRAPSPSWNPDAPCGSKDVPGNARLYHKGPMTEEELNDLLGDSLSVGPFGSQSKLPRSSSWDRPLSVFVPPDRKLSWTASQAHLVLVPTDTGKAVETAHEIRNGKRK
jgi:hypothetical protein